MHRGIYLLDDCHSGELLRLQRILKNTAGFQFVLASYTDYRYRYAVIDYLQDICPSSYVESISAEITPHDLIENLIQLAQTYKLVHLADIETWLQGAGKEAWLLFNRSRERLTANIKATLVFWVEPHSIAQIAQEAPDLWAWRTAILDFSAGHFVLAEDEARRLQRRLGEIEDYLCEKQTFTAAEVGLQGEAQRIREQLALYHEMCRGKGEVLLPRV